MKIKIENLTQRATKTVVSPSDNIFQELGNNTYDYKDLLSELIDNSVAARIQGQLLTVNIDLYVNPTTYEVTEFIITDNGKGIPQDQFGLAITPAGRQTNGSLNEHGLGMKQAVAAIGDLDYLASKTKEDAKGNLVTKFGFGEIDTYECDFPHEHGTQIAIKNVKPIVTASPINITRTIQQYLGARYRKFLKAGSKQIDINIFLKDLEGNNTNSWNIEEVKPIYFHPSTRTNQPIFNSFLIEGASWKAELTFGYAPKDEDEYKELGLEKVSKFHPYNVSLTRQGLDILLHDRVMLFSQLSEIGIVNTKHNDYNVIRGEINLISGFKTAITKNSIISDKNFIECIQRIGGILKGEIDGPGGKKKNYIVLKTYPEEIPEKLLRDRLASWLGSNTFNKKQNVKTEFVIEGIEGYVDILADGETWELKTQQASALDVYQLFMYMDIGNINKGFLVAKSFSTGATVAAEYIKTKHNKEIVLSTSSDYPINHQPNEQERQDYY
jgi:hypothetical protein